MHSTKLFLIVQFITKQVLNIPTDPV